MVFIHRHSLNLRLNLSICRPYSALVSTEVLCVAASELGISRHLACAVGYLQGLTRTISPREKPCKVFLPEDPGSNPGCITMSRIQRTQPYKVFLPGLFSPLVVSVQRPLELSTPIVEITQT